MAAVESAPSALPYVAWSSQSVVVIPAADWPTVFGFMQALKGHVQEYPGCQKLEAFVEPAAADYRVTVYTRASALPVTAVMVLLLRANPLLILFTVVDALGALWTALALRADRADRAADRSAARSADRAADRQA